jgi:hypothetical protein
MNMATKLRWTLRRTKNSDLARPLLTSITVPPTTAVWTTQSGANKAALPATILARQTPTVMRSTPKATKTYCAPAISKAKIQSCKGDQSTRSEGPMKDLLTRRCQVRQVVCKKLNRAQFISVSRPRQRIHSRPPTIFAITRSRNCC